MCLPTLHPAQPHKQALIDIQPAYSHSPHASSTSEPSPAASAPSSSLISRSTDSSSASCLAVCCPLLAAAAGLTAASACNVTVALRKSCNSSERTDQARSRCEAALQVTPASAAKARELQARPAAETKPPARACCLQRQLCEPVEAAPSLRAARHAEHSCSMRGSHLAALASMCGRRHDSPGTVATAIVAGGGRLCTLILLWTCALHSTASSQWLCTCIPDSDAMPAEQPASSRLVCSAGQQLKHAARPSRCLTLTGQCTLSGAACSAAAAGSAAGCSTAAAGSGCSGALLAACSAAASAVTAAGAAAAGSSGSLAAALGDFGAGGDLERPISASGLPACRLLSAMSSALAARAAGGSRDGLCLSPSNKMPAAQYDGNAVTALSQQSPDSRQICKQH